MCVWFYAVLLSLNSLTTAPCRPKHVAIFSVILYHMYLRNKFYILLVWCRESVTDSAWNEQHKMYLHRICVLYIQLMCTS